VSFAQTLMPLQARHCPIGGKVIPQPHQLHPNTTIPKIISSQRTLPWLDGRQQYAILLHSCCLIGAILHISCCRLIIFVVQMAAMCGVVLCARIFFDKEYHVEGIAGFQRVLRGSDANKNCTSCTNLHADSNFGRDAIYSGMRNSRTIGGRHAS